MSTEKKSFNLQSFDVKRYDSILARGLCYGVGARDGQMCIEAAICTTLGLPHGDDPECVSEAVRYFKISLNDCSWSSAEARASGLRDLGIAQLGSKGVVNDVEFSTKLAEKTIRILIPEVLDLIDDPKVQKASERCREEGSYDAASYAASYAANDAASDKDAFLKLIAKLALEVLIELKSPGVSLLNLEASK